MQEVERLEYRNRSLLLIRTPNERLPPHGVWPHALARVATLRSKAKLVPFEDIKATEDSDTS
jgi:hypothetical protein